MMGGLGFLTWHNTYVYIRVESRSTLGIRRVSFANQHQPFIITFTSTPPKMSTTWNLQVQRRMANKDIR